MNDKELGKELFKKVINPFFFNDENLKTVFKINLESHNYNHANSFSNVVPKFPDIGIGTIFINKSLE